MFVLGSLSYVTNKERFYQHRESFKKYLMEILDLLSFGIMALGIVLCVRFFIFSPFTVVGQSMEPTFQTNNFVIIDKVVSQKMKLAERSSTGQIKYSKSIVGSAIKWLPTLERGDIIVFVPPGKDIHYIKRVVGLPWETVTIKDSVVTICKTVNLQDCFVLDESYLWPDTVTNTPCGVSTFVVEKWLFVMGDNREHSTDSRCCFTIGCYGNDKWYLVPYDDIIGRVRARLFPNYMKF